MEHTEIRLEIAKAAIAASLSREEASQWLDWVLASAPAVQGDNTSLKKDDITYHALEDAVFEIPFRLPREARGYCLIDALLNSEELSLKKAVALCYLYKINHPRDFIIAKIDAGEIQGIIPEIRTHMSDGRPVSDKRTKGNYSINRYSLLQWLSCNHHLSVGGIIARRINEILSQQPKK